MKDYLINEIALFPYLVISTQPEEVFPLITPVIYQCVSFSWIH